MTAMRRALRSVLTYAVVALFLSSFSLRVFAVTETETNKAVAGVIPYGPDQAPDDVKLELAKSGVQHFLQGIVEELVAPTNSPSFTSQANHSSDDAVAIRSKAFEKLAYIANPSTVRVVASFLSDTTHPPSKPMDVRYVSYAEMAANALSQIVTNCPPTAALSAQDKIRVWRQWWEQNKGKYP